MTERSATAMCAAAAVLLWTAPATADKARSLEIFDRATQKYQAGELDAAVDLYVEAYETHPAPEYLFNIAQSHRKLEHCEQALHYYRLYLSVTKNARGRSVAEKHAEALGETCSPSAANAVEVTPPDPVPPAVDTGPAVDTVVASPARTIATIAEVGPAFYDIGEVDVNLRLGVRVGAAFLIDAGPVTLDLGLTGELSAMPYDFGAEGTAALVSALANVGAAYFITKRLSVRGELGVGDQAFLGLGAGNPFSEGAMETGALHMLSVRVAIGVEYWLTPGLAVVGSPVVYGYSLRNDELAADIRSIQKLSVLAGLAYAL